MLKRLGLFLLFLLPALPSFAATTANSVITAQVPQQERYQFTHSITAGTYETVYTAGPNGSKVTGLFVSNNDTSATHVVTCGIYNTSVQYASWSVTTTSPSAGLYNNLAMLTSWVGLPVDSDGNPFMYLVSGDTIQCAAATTITTSDFVVVTAIGADF